MSFQKYACFNCVTAWWDIHNSRQCVFIQNIRPHFYHTLVWFPNAIWVQESIKSSMNITISKYEMIGCVGKKNSVRTPKSTCHIQQGLRQSHRICKMSFSVSEKFFLKMMRLDHTLKMQHCAHYEYWQGAVYAWMA